MSVFGFIENFFFISLALVFVLVLFLVYHFKSRITVAEKKSESMYGLLTAVVKEIKLLRGMFGLGSTPQTPNQESINMEVKSKTEPEVNVPIQTQNNTFESFVKKDAPSKEVITFEILESENRIVVSDMEDSDSDEESAESITPNSDDDDAEDEEDTEDDDSVSIESLCIQNAFDVSNALRIHHQNPTDALTGVVPVNGLDTTGFVQTHQEDAVEVFLENILDEPVLGEEPVLEEEPVVNIADEPSVKLADEPVVNIAEEPSVNIAEEPSVKLAEEHSVNIADKPVVMDISAFENEPNELNQPIAVNEQELDPEPVTNKNKPTNDQLRKMNINQLKSIASQLGITEDVSKMKKPELISLIQQK
jgi:hypothetical protein